MAKLKVHLRGKWHGVDMGWAACMTYVAPFAQNLTTERNRVTCKNCLRILGKRGLP
jgi:hypothetical protein